MVKKLFVIFFMGWFTHLLPMHTVELAISNGTKDDIVFRIFDANGNRFTASKEFSVIKPNAYKDFVFVPNKKTKYAQIVLVNKLVADMDNDIDTLESYKNEYKTIYYYRPSGSYPYVALYVSPYGVIKEGSRSGPIYIPEPAIISGKNHATTQIIASDE